MKLDFSERYNTSEMCGALGLPDQGFFGESDMVMYSRGIGCLLEGEMLDTMERFRGGST